MINLRAPKQWYETRVDAIADIVREVVDPADITRGTNYVGLEHIESSGDFLDVAPVSNGELASAKFRFTPEHVLFGKLRPYLRKVARPTFSGVCSTDILPLKPKAGISRDYLFHYLRHPRVIEEATIRCSGANLPRLSPSQLESFPVVLPPTLAEQKRIAAILDKADAIRRRRQAALNELANLPHALFDELFGSPRTNDKCWPLRPFGEVCESRLGKMLDAKQQSGEHARPYLRNLNVQWGRLDLSTVFAMDFDEGEREEFRLRSGDVMICEGGAGVGQTAIWRDELPECYFQKSLHRVRPNPSLAVPEYIAHLMWMLMKSDCILGAISSATIPHLTGVKLKCIPIPVPPLHLQRTFAKQVEAVARLQAAQSVSRAEGDMLFGAVVQRAFRGEL